MIYNNPLHRRSIRLKNYDYSRPGAYFITICTNNRENLFGEIHDGDMVLNPYGHIAYKEWLNTPVIRPNIELDDFVIMPNHIHGIVVIVEPYSNRDMEWRDGGDNGVGIGDDARRGVLQYAPTNVNIHTNVNTPSNINSPATVNAHTTVDIPPNINSPTIVNIPSNVDTNTNTNTGVDIAITRQHVNQTLKSPSQTIGAIVRGYKSATATQIKKNGYAAPVKIWQRNYWEHIIRNADELERIRNYINANPARWESDKLYGGNFTSVKFIRETTAPYGEEPWMA